MTKSEQARADAMADAETLRLVAETDATDWYRGQLSVASYISRSEPEVAARFAFYSVPGLR